MNKQARIHFLLVKGRPFQRRLVKVIASYLARNSSEHQAAEAAKEEALLRGGVGCSVRACHKQARQKRRQPGEAAKKELARN